ncbi:tripartite tricarboxylate transporter substrate binding protein [Reyranella sp.]|uniref:Bug family tripartite tricarboxylate transporter substrate binding protein n=1 Tax=Reyranella sp. TaxID=1929291 RepID=UPI0025D1F7B2|nr:tripartite tricarboxylate transporter substrate binding protein [Reyranella sp.]
MYRRSLLAAPLVLAAASAHAQQWVPKHPIKILVGYAPGGTADIAARLAADAIQRLHGYTVVVDNKTGAGGFIALKAVAQSPPDGYTVGIGIMGQLAVGPVVPGSQIPLDLDKELVPICNLVGVPMALIVRVDAPFKTVPELVAYAKASPGKVTYASTGLGSTNQLGAEFLAAEAGGLKLNHIPYRGGAPAIADVAAGQVDLFFGNISELIGQARGGKVRVLALASTKPSALAPELPLLTKDIPALDINNWFGLMGPAGLPADIKNALAKLFLEAMSDPKNAEALAKQGLEPIGQGPEAFAAYILKDRERWGKVAKEGNVRAQ